MSGLSDEVQEKYLRYKEVEIKSHEVETLRSLVKELLEQNQTFEICDGYFIGYKIPQIGKEFDLLRFGTDSIINIELKTKSDEDTIQKQLIRNKYYLSFIEKQNFFFTYVSETKTLYKLDNEILVESSITDLLQLINEQEIELVSDIDSYFHPSNYLVSPFNSTDRFLNNEYFLTIQQEKVKKEVFTEINLAHASFIAIEGKPGTGKTLLSYDITKEARQASIKTQVIHCGKLNDGQNTLWEQSWSIIPAKDTEKTDFTMYDLIVVDEVQRMYPEQLKYLIEQVRRHNKTCIFSYDANQTLRRWEEQNNNVEKLIKTLPHLKEFVLSKKVRTNKEVANFIGRLFNIKDNKEKIHNSNVEIQYFSTTTEAKLFLEYKKTQDWKVINLTSSSYNKEFCDKYIIAGEDNAHDVIGQEYENVITIVDNFFSYNDEGELVYTKKSYYSPPKMLFQIVTRTRTKLCLVIIDNEKVMSRCLDILTV